jgi:hypothetical protein
VSAADFTSGQRRIVILLVITVVFVFAMLAGFVITSLQGWESPPPTVTPSVSSTATATLVPPTSPPTPLPSPTLSPTVDSEEGIWLQVKAARLFNQIAHQVETLRGLSPRAEVPLSFLDEREMTTLLRHLYAGRDPEAFLLPYTELGLLPDVSVRIRPHQTAGIYVSEQEQLYVATSPQESSADDQALLAHAYVHVLQDQHFDLGAMDARAATTDATMAVRALVEGDAALLTAFYRYGDPASADWEHLSALILQAEQPGYGEELDGVAAWVRLQHFPYWEGRYFAYALFQVNGWSTIDGAYINPPRSTEQVLHPERYLEGQSEPTRITIPDLSSALDEDWTMLLQDTLGEFVIGLYLEAWLPENMAWQAADGWDGDTFVVWEHDDEDRLFVWRTIWNSTVEAVEFENALIALVPERYLPAWPIDPPRGLVGWWWETETGAVYVSRVARHVVFAHAQDVDTLVDVVEKLP